MVVAITLAAAWTLLPAMLAALGPRVERGSLPQRWQPPTLAATPTRCAGAVAPIQVVVPDGTRNPAAVAELTRRLSADERVARVETVPDSDGPAVVLPVVASVPIDSPQAYDLVRDLRSLNGPSPDDTVPEELRVLIGGATAQYVDLSAETRWALPVVLARSPSRSRWTPPWSGWSWYPRSCVCSGSGTGGYPAGLTRRRDLVR